MNAGACPHRRRTAAPPSIAITSAARVTSRAGSGGTYTLTEEATTHKVTACKKGNANAPIAECLANATYSSFLQFETDRVIREADAN